MAGAKSNLALILTQYKEEKHGSPKHDVLGKKKIKSRREIKRNRGNLGKKAEKRDVFQRILATDKRKVRKNRKVLEGRQGPEKR